MMDRPEMPEAEMRRGFAMGRTLVQEEWSSDDEKSAIDRLAKEGVCTVTAWEYRPNFQCFVRRATGVIASEAKQSTNLEGNAA